MTDNTIRNFSGVRSVLLPKLIPEIVIVTAMSTVFAADALGWLWVQNIAFLTLLIAMVWLAARIVKRGDRGCFPVPVAGPPMVAHLRVVRDESETSNGRGDRP
ncbi:hypothetical protein [Gordonia sp. UCD-TK1]|uniref:hypothetical protein n=1 Tax=Gordonia sp. UCD-TK1 TaxID=1857893 RepID=UPI00080E85BB|nr:hypothetical protein [Gordonia sp. UCD-TK1]OCH81461.1 hypothetical protein A9310_17400 [Gordonia sp. UCD-TK1]